MFNPAYPPNYPHNTIMIVLILSVLAVIATQLAANRNRNRYDRDRNKEV
jgi:hypothetical protein